MNQQPQSFIADLLALLDEDRRYEFEERAGIMEYDGGVDRDQAELLALVDLLRSHPGALLGVTLLRVERGGKTYYAIATDVAAAAERLRPAQVSVVETDEVAQTLSALGGLALLKPIPKP
jgi:hypothetical protein